MALGHKKAEGGRSRKVRFHSSGILSVVSFPLASSYFVREDIRTLKVLEYNEYRIIYFYFVSQRHVKFSAVKSQQACLGKFEVST